MNEILAYDTAQVEADFYLQTHSTNPLLKAETISAAVQKFRQIGYDERLHKLQSEAAIAAPRFT